MKTQLRDNKGRFVRLTKKQANFFSVEVRPSIIVRDAQGRFMSFNTLEKTEHHPKTATTLKVRNIKSNRNPSVAIDRPHYLTADIRIINN